LGKAPARRLDNGTWIGYRGWPDAVIRREDVTRWLADGASIGLRTKRWPAIDCDIEDERLATELRPFLARQLGVESPVRIGNPPKFAIACRADIPFAKRKLSFTHPNRTSAGAIEFLGDSQEYVISGIHAK